MYNIREMTEKDTSFIFDSWLKSWRTSRYSGVVRNKDYYAVYRATIEDLIGRGSVILLAVNPENTDHIYGWICYELTPDNKTVIHYLYVKDPFHKYKIDSALLDQVPGEKPGFFTFKYPQVEEALVRRWPGTKWSWVPEIGRRK